MGPLSLVTPELPQTLIYFGSEYLPGLNLDLTDDLDVTFPKVGMFLERPQLLVTRAGCGAVAKRQLGEDLSLRCDREGHCGVGTASHHLRGASWREKGAWEGSREGLGVQILSQGTQCAPSLALCPLRLLLLQWLHAKSQVHTCDLGSLQEAEVSHKAVTRSRYQSCRSPFLLWHHRNMLAWFRTG